MDTASPEGSKPSRPRGRWQFTPRHLLFATTGVAMVLGLASWGGWLYSDAVVYLSIAVLAAIFSSIARRVLFGGCAILGSFWLALVLGNMVFGVQGRGGDPRSLWILAGLLTASATLLRLYTKASAFSLVASLLVTELFTAVVIVYFYGCPTLFEAFNEEHRESVLLHLRRNFPTVEQWFFVVPWLAGIVLGEFLARRRKAGHQYQQHRRRSGD